MTPNNPFSFKPKSNDKIDLNHVPRAVNRISYCSRKLKRYEILKTLINLDNLTISVGRCLLRSDSWILQEISLVCQQDPLHPVTGWPLSHLTSLQLPPIFLPLPSFISAMYPSLRFLISIIASKRSCSQVISSVLYCLLTLRFYLRESLCPLCSDPILWTTLFCSNRLIVFRASRRFQAIKSPAMQFVAPISSVACVVSYISIFVRTRSLSHSPPTTNMACNEDCLYCVDLQAELEEVKAQQRILENQQRILETRIEDQNHIINDKYRAKIDLFLHRVASLHEKFSHLSNRCSHVEESISILQYMMEKRREGYIALMKEGRGRNIGGS